MRKSLLALFALTLVLVLSSDTPAEGNELNKRIAIIDTGIDATHSSLQGKVVQEVCILDFALCPNNSKFMEGPGSATLDPVKAANNSFYHGTQMSSIVLQNTPNAEIVFIRVVAMTPKGGRASVSVENIGRALEWVKNNAQTYNIGVVSVSMGLPNKTASCASNSLVENSIVALKDMGIPAVFANGNSGRSDRIDYPACFAPSIAVGGADFVSGKYYPALYNNHTAMTDFFAFGKMTVAAPNNTTTLAVGSSAATALLASEWLQLANSGLSYQEVYDRLVANSTLVTTKKVQNGLVLDHNL